MLTYRPRENYEIHNLVLLLFKSEQNTKLVLRVHCNVVYRVTLLFGHLFSINEVKCDFYIFPW